MERIILKLGGSVITKKDSAKFPMHIDEIKKCGDDYIRTGDARRLGNEIYEATQERDIQLVLVNGVGPFGHFLVKNWDKLDDKAMVHESVKLLNERLIEIMERCGLKIRSFAPFDSRREDGIYSVYRIWGVGAGILNEGKIFSTYGDIVPDASSEQSRKYGYRVVSGDELVVEIAKLWEPDKIIMATDVDGIFTENPHIDKNAKLIKKFHGSEKVDFSLNKAIDVSGEMGGKVDKLLKSGVKSQIVNGLVAGNVKSALLGDESIGTLILTE